MTLHRRSMLGALVGSGALASICSPVPARSKSSPNVDWHALAQEVRSEMAWAWRNYVELAFGHDQIKPVSGGVEDFFFP
jgi:mannosyl-oligosaccharide alpha-1,2-mannosidase